MESLSSEDDFVVLSLLKREKERKKWVHPILRYRELLEFPQHGRAIQSLLQDVMGSVWCFIAILESHITKKTTNFCELSVQGSLHCFVLRDEVDELDIAILDFGDHLYGGSELSKHLSKYFLQMRKTQKKYFFHVNVVDTTWGCICFSTCKNVVWKFQTRCAVAFRAEFLRRKS